MSEFVRGVKRLSRQHNEEMMAVNRKTRRASASSLGAIRAPLPRIRDFAAANSWQSIYPGPTIPARHKREYDS